MAKKCSICGNEYEPHMFSSRGGGKKEAECKFCKRKRNTTRARALRYKILCHYSKTEEPQCACCKEHNLEFLSLDHINGGGRKQRATIKVSWWQWLWTNGLPEGFRVLCHNCNQSIGLYGYCPHSLEPGEKTKLHIAIAAYDPEAPSRSRKLSPEEVTEIREKINSGLSQASIARDYNISRATVCMINSGKRWGNH